MIFELDNFLRKAPRSADRALLLVLQGLNDALPTVKMPAFGGTPITHLVGTNTAIQNPLLDGGSTTLYSSFPLHFRWQIIQLFLAELSLCLPNTIYSIEMLDHFDNKTDQNEISFKLIIDIFQTLTLVCVDIVDSKDCLEDGEFFIPIQHEKHQHNPLNIYDDIFRGSHIIFDKFLNFQPKKPQVACIDTLI